MQSVSIIITCGKQQMQLRRLLPQVLSLHYDGEYEVVVVDAMHDKDFLEWLEDMEVHYPHLSHTFCPSTSRGINLQRLAFTLGAKAACFDWLVFLTPDALLPSDDWLKHLAEGLNVQADIVVGTVNYERSEGGTDKKKRLRQHWRQLAWPVLARKCALYRLFHDFIMYRREFFLEHEKFKSGKAKRRVWIDKSAATRITVKS